MCMICNADVKSKSFWRIHMNSKKHRDNIFRKDQNLDRNKENSSTDLNRKPLGSKTVSGNIFMFLELVFMNFSN